MTDKITFFPYGEGDYLLIRHMPNGTKRAIHQSDDVDVVSVGATTREAVNNFIEQYSAGETNSERSDFDEHNTLNRAQQGS